MIDTMTVQSLAMGNGTNYTIIGASGFESPPVEVAWHPFAGRHGATVHRSLYRARRSRIEFVMRAATAAAYATLRENFIKAWDLPRNGNTLVYFTTADGKQLQMTANLADVIDGGFQPGRMTSGGMRIELIVGDPSIYSQTLNEQTLAPPTPGGVTIPTVVPFALSLTGGSVNISNGGNGPSYPALRITGPATTPTVRNSTLGIQFQITTNIASGHYVNVDPLEQTVLYDGATNYLQYFSGDFWWLKPGTNQINFNTDDLTAALRIQWRNAYLGI